MFSCSYFDRCVMKLSSQFIGNSLFYTSWLTGVMAFYTEVYSLFSPLWISYDDIYLKSSGLWKECFTSNDCYTLIGKSKLMYN